MTAHDFYSRDRSIFGIVINSCDFNFIFVLNGLTVVENESGLLYLYELFLFFHNFFE